MAKDIKYDGRIEGITLTERNEIQNAAESWYNPASGNFVDNIVTTYVYDSDTDTTSYNIRVLIEKADVANTDIQTVMENLGTQINNLNSGFGTVQEIIDDMMIR